MPYPLSIITLLLALLAYRLRNVGRRPKGLPPGPPTLPLLGNLHLMPTKDPHHQFKKWAEDYGPVYSLVLGTKIMIVLTSPQAIKDLLDKRSNIYSSRPDMYLMNVLSDDLRMIGMPYGEKWRMIRKMGHSTVNIGVAKAYVPYQDLENKHMLSGILDQPHLFIDHIRRYSTSLTTQMIFGFRTIAIDDPRLKELYAEVDELSRIGGSLAGALLEAFPLLRKLPDLFWPVVREAKQAHVAERDLFVGHWLNVKNAVAKGTSKPCFCVDLVQKQKVYNFSDDQAAYISGSFLEAGADTTANSVVGFVQAMVLYPDAQRRAQAELDRVVGPDRLPDIDDMENLPFIRACTKETLRWMPTAVLGLPHAVIQDDEYNGYNIPKGAGVLWNVWGINMDARRFPRPREFVPERYLGDEQTSYEAATNPDASKRDHFVFGAGRRMCQGMHIADRSMFFAISRMLWAFNFEKAMDAQGREITPDQEAFTEGFLVQPEPFPAKVTPRSEKHAEMVRTAWTEAQRLLDREKQWAKIPDSLRENVYFSKMVPE